MKALTVFVVSILLSGISFGATCSLERHNFSGLYMVMVDDNVVARELTSVDEQIFTLKSFINVRSCDRVKTYDCRIESNLKGTGLIITAKGASSSSLSGPFKSLEYANKVLQDYKAVGVCK